jgi:thyroid adenoma-associated protein
MREISFMLGTLVQVMPLSPPPPSAPLLRPSQLNDIGTFFVTALSTAKHNGATEKLHLGFEAVARCALRESSPELNRLPGQWLQTLFEPVARRGQSRTSIVRRSAGLPLAFVALCHAEQNGAARTLLPTAAQRLLDVARSSRGGARCAGEPAGAGATVAQPASASEEPWPRVHAFNCLRTIFASAALAGDASGFFAEGLQACVLAMTASEWDVRCLYSFNIRAVCFAQKTSCVSAPGCESRLTQMV